MARLQIIKPEMAEARSKGLLNIGQAAEASGVSAKSTRHYEESGLIPEAQRTYANYRLYSQADLHTLCFIKSARSLAQIVSIHAIGIRIIQSIYHEYTWHLQHISHVLHYCLFYGIILLKINAPLALVKYICLQNSVPAHTFLVVCVAPKLIKEPFKPSR